MMAGDKSGKPAKQAKTVVEDKQLQEDVKNFAAQLGLSGAGGAGFEGAFDDFKPELAQRKIGQGGDKGPHKQPKYASKALDKPGSRHQERQPHKRQPEQQQQQQQTGARGSGGKVESAGRGGRRDGNNQQQQNGDAKPWKQQQQQHANQGGPGGWGQTDKQDWQGRLSGKGVTSTQERLCSAV